MGSGDWGTVELERFRTADQSAIIFSTSSNELDDTDLEPDIPPGNGVYRYRARYNIPQRPLGPWSPVVEARTLPLVEAFNKGELTIPEGTGWAGYCLVQRFEAGVLSRSGSQISITLRASTAGLSIDRIYISQADPAVGMDPYDSLPNTLATMQDTLWKPPNRHSALRSNQDLHCSRHPLQPRSYETATYGRRFQCHYGLGDYVQGAAASGGGHVLQAPRTSPTERTAGGAEDGSAKL
jgi:hypothetical protein